MPQLDPGNGKTKKAYLWAYRSGWHAQQFLDNWHGYLLVDDYGGYKALFAAARAHPESQRQLEPYVELACWAHARRKFFDLHPANHSPIALAALNRMAELYAVEAEAKTKTLSIFERQALRAEKKRIGTGVAVRLAGR